MKKRFIRAAAVFLAGLMLLPLCTAVGAEYDYASLSSPKMIVTDGSDPSIVYFEREADAKAFPASTTKIMTCILALENLELDREITVGEEIHGFYEREKGYTSQSSLMGLEEGEKVTVRDLLYGLMLVSGNDAADAIAVAISGSVKGFAELMNQKAASLGMTNTHFVNPNGVQHQNHYTTARDMARLTAYALNNEDFCTIVSTPSYTLSPTNKHPESRVKNNTNKLLYKQETDTETCLYEYAIGVKTGDTTSAGKCLVAAARKDGATLIAVRYGDANEEQYNRFRTTAELFEDLFATKYTLVSTEQLHPETEFRVRIEGAMAEDVDENGETVLHAAPDSIAKRLRTEEVDAWLSRGCTSEVTWTRALSAPVSKGTQLGTVTYRCGDEVLCRVPLYVESDIRETTILNAGTSTGSSAALLVTDIEPTPSEKPVEKTAPAATKEPAKTVGEEPEPRKTSTVILTVLLVVVLVVLVLFILAVIVRAKKRAAAKRRRRARAAKARAEAQRRAQEYYRDR